MKNLEYGILSEESVYAFPDQPVLDPCVLVISEPVPTNLRGVGLSTRRTSWALALGSMLVLLPGVARSLQATLEDGSPVNTKMRIETVTPSPYPYGVYYWDVEGIEHLQRQWFWYRIGSSPESNVASVPHFSAPVMNDTTGEGYDDQLVAVYQDPIGLRIRVILTLRGNGAGSHEAWVTESIKLQNLTSSPMNLAFFQYTDFNLNSNPADDQLELFGPSLANARHEDSMTVVTQKITGHLPVEAEVDVVDGIGDILARMGDANPSSLSNTAGPVGGDGSYAYRWNFSLGSSGSPSDSVDFDIEKRIESLPPPVLPVGSSFLYVLGALGLGGAARYTLRR